MNLFKVFSITFIRLMLIVLALHSFQQTALAKDMSSRAGFGFNNEFSNSTWTKPAPALSLKYGMSRDMAIEGIAGFNTSNPSAVTIGSKLYKNIFYESNLNFYSAVALAYVKLSESGMEIIGVMGAEYFIPGLESLGLQFEAGISGENSTGTFIVKTVGFTFFNAGMHFYF